MLSHSLENGVLVLTVDDDPGPEAEENALAVLIRDLVHVHAPTPVVVVLSAEAGPVVIDAVVDAHRMCGELDVLMSVAAPSAPARRALQTRTAAHGGGLVVHARADTAITTAYSTAA
ncbi:hypothetical protein AB0D33_16095 [Streptomyces sp. NPDC048404]|uniref:hypothetical protein n=1 Tax=unclassified Streptomyces TaxID=2593676 RepID=UPI00342F2E8E